MDILKKDRQIRALYIATFISLLAVMILIFCFIIYKHYDDLLKDRYVAGMFTTVEVPEDTRPGDTLVFEQVVKTHSHTIQTRDIYLLVRTNHQSLKLYLSGGLLFESGAYNPDENPGMGMYFVELPGNFAGKTLRAELVSPYARYHGRMPAIFVSDLDTLNYYVVEKSMRSIIMLSLCLFLGVCTITLTLWQSMHTRRDITCRNLCIGLFAILLGVYYVCTELITYKLLSPTQMSAFSIGSYLSWQVPLCWFFYFSFSKYKKSMLPAAIAHTAFVLTAYALQTSGIVQFPRILNINNSLMTVGFLYIIVLCVLEILGRNRYLMFVTPFMVYAYVSLMRGFFAFYFTKGSVNYNVYRDTFLIMVSCLLIYSVFQFLYKNYGRRD